MDLVGEEGAQKKGRKKNSAGLHLQIPIKIAEWPPVQPLEDIVTAEAEGHQAESDVSSDLQICPRQFSTLGFQPQYFLDLLYFIDPILGNLVHAFKPLP